MEEDKIKLLKKMIEEDPYEKLLNQTYTPDAGGEAARIAISIKQTKEAIDASSKHAKSLTCATWALVIVTIGLLAATGISAYFAYLLLNK